MGGNDVSYLVSDGSDVVVLRGGQRINDGRVLRDREVRVCFISRQGNELK